MIELSSNLNGDTIARRIISTEMSIEATKTPGIAKTTGRQVALLLIVTEGQLIVVLNHIGNTKGIISVNEEMVIISTVLTTTPFESSRRLQKPLTVYAVLSKVATGS